MALPVLFRTTPIRRSLRRAPLFDLSTEMDHLLEDLWRGPLAPRKAVYTPRIDLVETPTEFRVSAELPGMTAEDFHIELKDGTLLLHGEKTAAGADKAEVGWHRAERSYGRFERAIRFPVEVDADAAKAEYRDGILSIALPKAASAQVREIPVEAAAS